MVGIISPAACPWHPSQAVHRHDASWDCQRLRVSFRHQMQFILQGECWYINALSMHISGILFVWVSSSFQQAAREDYRMKKLVGHGKVRLYFSIWCSCGYVIDMHVRAFRKHTSWWRYAAWRQHAWIYSMLHGMSHACIWIRIKSYVHTSVKYLTLYIYI